jgi:superfamily I DNA/RNA helicase
VITLAEQLEEASSTMKRDGDLIHWLQWLYQNRLKFLGGHDIEPEEFRRIIDFAFRLARACRTPGRFLDVLAEPVHADHVTIGTFHGSKGHGWDTVFIVGASRHNMEALHEKCKDRLFAPGVLDGGLDGERRLLHVGMSRAAHNLFLTWPGGLKNASSFIDQAGLQASDHPGIVVPRITPRAVTSTQKMAAIQLVLF